MDNKIKKEVLKILANAPAYAMRAYLKTLTPPERAEAERLIKALKIKMEV